MKRLLYLLLLVMIAIPFTASAQDDATPVYEVFVTEDGSFITLMPDGWVAKGNFEDGLIVANNADALYMMSNDSEDFTAPQPGEFGLGIAAFPNELFELFELPEDASYSEILTTFLGLMMDDPSFPAIEEQGELAGDEFGFAGAYATGSNELMDLQLVVFDLSANTTGVVLMAAAPSEMSNFEAEAAQILITTSYTSPLEEVYSSEDSAVEFAYPAGWKADVDENGLVYVTNDPEVTTDTTLQSGQFAVAVIDLSALGMAGDTMEASANNILPVLLAEGDVADDPVILAIGEDKVLVINVDNEDETVNDGGLVIREVDGTMYAAVYASAYDEARLIGYTAAAILLSIGQ